MDKYTIPPKPGYFDGDYLRVQNEIHWCAFFKELDYDQSVHYECIKLETRSGTYRPDLWLPKWDVYVEIKPAEGVCERERYEQVAIECNVTILLVVGRAEAGKYVAALYTPKRVLGPGKLGEVDAERKQLVLVDESKKKRRSARLEWREKGLIVPESQPVTTESPWITNAFARAKDRVEKTKKQSQSRPRRAFRSDTILWSWSSDPPVSSPEQP
jgi:hypothetical protein